MSSGRSGFTGDVTPPTVFFTALWTGAVVFGAIVMRQFVMKRHLQPIAARPFWIACGHLLTVWMYPVQVGTSWTFREGYPCILVLLFGWPTLTACANLYLSRCWLLWFQYKLEQEKSEFPSDITKHPQLPSQSKSKTKLKSKSRSKSISLSQSQQLSHWYLSHRHWESSTFLLKWFGAKGAIEWLVMISPLFISPRELSMQTLDQPVFCPAMSWTAWALIVVISYNSVLIVYAAWKLEPVTEAFNIKLELGAAGLLALVAIVALAVVEQLSVNFELFPFASAIGSVVCLSIFCVSSVLPLSKVRSRRKFNAPTRMRSILHGKGAGPKRKSIENSVSLVEFISTNEGREEFREHLKTEFSVENLIFWETVNAFRETFASAPERDDGNTVTEAGEVTINVDPSRPSLTASSTISSSTSSKPEGAHPAPRLKVAIAANHIVERFILVDAPLQVNLASTYRVQVEKDLECGNISPDMFNKAQQQIYRLMTNDSFNRFKLKTNR